jgi:hypothetical protein
MEPIGNIICTFVVASANTTLFTDERPVIPEVGELIRYDSKIYEVISVSPQEPPLGEPLDEAAPQLSALVRVQLSG